MAEKKNSIKKILWTGSILLLAGAAVAWYLFTKKFEDTATVKADYTVTAIDFIREFRRDNAAANKKYSEKIIAVNGNVSETEALDSSINIKIIDTATGDYAIFAFQQKDMAAAKSRRCCFNKRFL
jgi:predicted phosphodiesterase